MRWIWESGLLKCLLTVFLRNQPKRNVSEQIFCSDTWRCENRVKWIQAFLNGISSKRIWTTPTEIRNLFSDFVPATGTPTSISKKNPNWMSYLHYWVYSLTTDWTMLLLILIIEFFRSRLTPNDIFENKYFFRWKWGKTIRKTSENFASFEMFFL